MIKKAILLSFLSLIIIQAFSQNINAVQLSELIANNARFKPYDKTKIDILATFDKNLLISNLKTDEQKFSFWLNVYNANMLILMRDTLNAGNIDKLYKTKNILVAGYKLSLFNIENEFLRCAVKNKKLGFKKAEVTRKDTFLRKLKPLKPDFRVIFCMYKGLYGYPPYQIIENNNISEHFQNFVNQHTDKFAKNNEILIFDWINNYKTDLKNNPIDSIFKGYKVIIKKTPRAIFVENFFPRYEKVKFDEEEINPWLK